MKRKFSFGLPPLVGTWQESDEKFRSLLGQKIPSRAETRALKAALNSDVDFTETPISPPLSPFIYRRPLDSRTERELRNACAEIVEENDEPEQKLNFQPLNATKAIASKEAAAPVSKQARANAQLSQPSSHHPIRQSSKPDTRYSEDSYEIPANQDASQSNARAHKMSNTREGQTFPARKDSISTRTANAMNPLLMCPPERSRTALLDSSMSDKSTVTPKTGSTDQHYNYASTTLTSAEHTPSHISKRASQLGLDNDAYRAAQQQADTKAAVEMRQELEKRRQHVQTTQAPQPPPSRSSARAWINDVREFVRPGSSSGIRPGSSAGRPVTGTSQTRTSLSRDRQGSGSFHSSSAQGWRSWSGLRRKSSKSSFGDFNGDENPGGRLEQSEDGPNLNKGLPSLPSLDTWKDPQSQPKTGSGQHISMLMKGGSSKNKASKSSAAPQKTMPLAVRVERQVHVAESGITASKSIPQKQAFDKPPYIESPPSPPNRTIPIAKSQVRRISAAPEDRRIPAVRAHHSKTSSTDSCFSPASSVGAHQSADLRGTQQRLTRQESNVDLSKVSERLETHHRMQRMKSYTKSASSLSHQRHLSDSTSQTRPTTEDGRAPNYNRNMSSDRPVSRPLQNKIEITALPVLPQKNKPGSRLRRVLSKLEITNKSNRQPKSWMDAFEANGVKTGVLEARGPSAVPVVKY